MAWRRLMRVAAAVLLSALVSALTNSNAATYLDEADPHLDSRARAVIAGCEEELKSLLSNSFDLGVCLGVLKGLHYLSADVCVPPALTLPDIAGVLSRYFEAHPKDEPADFRERSLEALRAAWPCAGRRNI